MNGIRGFLSKVTKSNRCQTQKTNQKDKHIQMLQQKPVGYECETFTIKL